jgi:hypothetical protein
MQKLVIQLDSLISEYYQISDVYDYRYTQVHLFAHVN